jgi:eukaryotic-like serine/threonine-protein kinase
MSSRQPGRGLTSTRSQIKADRVARVLAAIVLIVLIAAVVISAFFLYRLVAGTVGRASGDAVLVPDVVGMTQQQAEDALRERSLAAQVIQNANTDEQDAGNVFRQEPPAGKSVRPGRTVKLTISLGPQTYVVPNMIGKQLEQAPEILSRARLSLGAVERVFIRGAKRGAIVNQNPIAGTSLASPAPVDITVTDTSGLPTVIIPLLTGITITAAEDELLKNNLQLAKVTYIADDTAPAGTVVQQQPAAYTDSSLGEKVELQVALPTEIKSAPQKTLSISIRIPLGPDKQRVKFKVFDALGSQVYDDNAEHAPGDLVEQKITVEGEAKVQIFIGDSTTPYREEML